MNSENAIVEKLRAVARKWLEDKIVDVVIGWGVAAEGQQVAPTVFVTKSEDVDKLDWNAKSVTNLVTYLKKKEIRKLGKIGIVVKGCDEKALVVLRRESQIDSQNLPKVIGIVCDTKGLEKDKCVVCDVHKPRFVDVLIAKGEPPAENPEVNKEVRYARLMDFMKEPREKRLAFWKKEFDRCIRCYACRQICPLCYCERCIVDRNNPQAVEPSATSSGNWAWGITRAFHLAGRCVGCGECTRVCPAKIDLALINSSLAYEAENSFDGFRAGMDPDREAIVGAFSRSDKEEFIQ